VPLAPKAASTCCATPERSAPPMTVLRSSVMMRWSLTALSRPGGA
jgi:hypothetical protein